MIYINLFFSDISMELISETKIIESETLGIVSTCLENMSPTKLNWDCENYWSKSHSVLFGHSAT